MQDFEVELDFEQALKQLKQEYAQALPQRINEIETVWHELDDDHWSRDRLATLIQLSHRLAGSGTTYGFARITESARALEMYAKSLNADTAPTSEQWNEMNQRLVDLANAV